MLRPDNNKTSTGETVLEIDLSALENNYRYLVSHIAPGTRFMAVVKAFAYGSEAARIALKLQELGADYFAVAYTNEGVALRDAGITRPILVLHPQPISYKTIIARCLEPALYSENLLEGFAKTARDEGQKEYPVHLKFNTGLNRLGFTPEHAGKIASEIKIIPCLRVASVFSHLAASEDPAEKEFTKDQLRSFARICISVEKELGYRPLRHLLNTSGILNYPDHQYDMVRSGIGLYGFGNDAVYDSKLTPVASLKTVISQIHEIGAGESVGYNRAFRASTPVRTATLPLGHADGIGRQYGNGKGYVTIRGNRAPIIGNVCMDMIMVDVTGIDCREGDEVVVFGKESSADLLAAAAGTISYELITGISQRVRRKITG
ncbi:alanine racemase [Zeaxanthinibacter enoshimensis]|uniref:Alanine racemase n=1 Tax=Zeaxanthinibacter enoshimensis TaxID=392009 RepID=A0A4R6TQY8_9FLAO|nr:alanine racemase [Zeaxanthinibacter enoshimensis]TDQ32896.1 alanine racemase [Zeaxanthinibacter enoshimensis]